MGGRIGSYRKPASKDPKLSLNAAVRCTGPRVGVDAGPLCGWCKQANIDAA